MFNELHWLPLRARIKYKILTLIFKAQRGLAPKFLVDVILRTHSASSSRPLCSLDRLDLLVPRSRTALAQSRSFASIGPSLWDHFFLQAVFHLPLPFPNPIFSHGALQTGSSSERFTQLEALCKCLNTIQSNMNSFQL